MNGKFRPGHTPVEKPLDDNKNLKRQDGMSTLHWRYVRLRFVHWDLTEGVKSSRILHLLSIKLEQILF